MSDAQQPTMPSKQKCDDILQLTQQILTLVADQPADEAASAMLSAYANYMRRHNLVRQAAASAVELAMYFTAGGEVAPPPSQRH